MGDHNNAYQRSNEMESVYQRVASTYDEIIALVSQAKRDCGGNARVKPVDDALKIVTLLERSLEPVDQSLYTQLSTFYMTLIRRLYQVKFQGDTQACDSMIKDLQSVKEGWLEAEQLAAESDNIDTSLSKRSEEEDCKNSGKQGA